MARRIGIEKIIEDIDKTKAKILELQNQLRNLERQKEEEEKTMLFGLARENNVSFEDLQAFIKAIGNGKFETPTTDLPQESEKKEDELHG